jgi:S1-C subfamily serine protease
MGLALVGFALLAAIPGEDGKYTRPEQELTPQEAQAIEINRKLAGPRPVTKRPPLSPTEAARVKVFKGARNSVVFVASITKKWFLEDNRTGDRFAVPPASGTGFVWDNLGHVVTNHHVITIDDPTGPPRGEAEELQVTLTDGKTYKAVVIGRSLNQDIAVLHVFAPLDRLKPLPIGSSKDLQVGQEVLAIGNPFGLDHTLTSGVVSALGRPILTGFNTHIRDAVQTDAAINPGNSGGPLLDRVGRLVGMNTAIRSTTGNSSGIGFAIPVETLAQVVPQLIAKGQLNRPELGFTTLTPAGTTSLGAARGIAVDSVIPGGLAAKAGLKGWAFKAGAKNPAEPDDLILGDVIIAFNGRTVDSDTQLIDYLELEPPEADLDFTVVRDGKQIHIVLRPKDEPAASESKDSTPGKPV